MSVRLTPQQLYPPGSPRRPSCAGERAAAHGLFTPATGSARPVRRLKSAHADLAQRGEVPRCDVHAMSAQRRAFQPSCWLAARVSPLRRRGVAAGAPCPNAASSPPQIVSFSAGRTPLPSTSSNMPSGVRASPGRSSQFFVRALACAARKNRCPPAGFVPHGTKLRASFRPSAAGRRSRAHLHHLAVLLLALGVGGEGAKVRDGVRLAEGGVGTPAMRRCVEAKFASVAQASTGRHLLPLHVLSAAARDHSRSSLAREAAGAG